MQSKYDLPAMDAEVRRIKSAVQKLQSMGADFPAVARNSVRILASLKMMEMNICDLVAIESQTESS
jgi:uncharacterized protein YukE